MADIRLNHVTKEFGKVVAVDDISLHVESGEFVVLVGPSGCGKTTSMRMIAGLESVSSGEIQIGGRRVNELSPGDRDIAMVFQNYALYSHFDVRGNLAFALKARKVPREKISARIDKVASLLGLSDVLDRKPRQLSGGQRQRVALGRAIIRDPEAFLMDEPLSNLDAALRLQMRKELIELTRELESTVIFVTHDQTEAMTMGHRLAVMNQGRIQQVGTPDEVYRYPANRFVAGFIGSPPMNFTEGELRQVNGQASVRAWGIDIPVDGTAVDIEARDVLVGVRPEDWDIGPEGFGSRVTVVENLGSESLVYSSNRDETVSFLVSSRLRPQVGEEIRLQPRPGNVHLFDSRNGERLGSPASS